jgi:hypothetical protein
MRKQLTLGNRGVVPELIAASTTSQCWLFIGICLHCWGLEAAIYQKDCNPALAILTTNNMVANKETLAALWAVISIVQGSPVSTSRFSRQGSYWREGPDWGCWGLFRVCITLDAHKFDVVRQVPASHRFLNQKHAS